MIDETRAKVIRINLKKQASKNNLENSIIEEEEDDKQGVIALDLSEGEGESEI